MNSKRNHMYSMYVTSYELESSTEVVPVQFSCTANVHELQNSVKWSA